MNKSISPALAAIKDLYDANFPTNKMDDLKKNLGLLKTADEHSQAGIFSSRIDADSFIKKNTGISFPLAIVSNFTYHPITNQLRSRLLAQGIYPKFYLSDYNQYHYEFLDSNSELYQSKPRLSLCLLDEHAIFDDLAPNWKIEQLESALDQKLVQLTTYAEHYHHNCQGLLLFTSLPLSANRLKQFVDYKMRAKVNHLWHQFNARLSTLSEQFKHVFIIDSYSLMHGEATLCDQRLAFYTKAYMSIELLDQIANEVAAIIRAQCGMAKKCLVLDLDNTLWGGILGDDGLDGIELSNTPIGEAHLDFQRNIKRLSEQGIILAISSKNDKVNVDKALAQRQDMLLKADDFSVIIANWEQKSNAISKISHLLNIGADSLVFVDDSAFEREEVKQQFPHLVVIDPGADPAEYVTALLQGNHFCQLELNPEDFKRINSYRTEAKRQVIKNESQSIEDFLNQLQLKLALFSPKSQDISRISQLSLRTNQFNMTTQRMSESDVQSYLSQPKHGVIVLQSNDRFGDYGQIGCIFYHIEKQSLCIDNFILSCRIFSRQVEIAALNHLLNWAYEQGLKEVRAKYIPTLKNTKVASFYSNHGFICVNDTPQQSRYCRELKDFVPLPAHIHITATYSESFI